MEQGVEKLIEDLLGAMDESINDSGQIASSAIAMAVERSHDLKMHPIMTIMMVKCLAEVNIKLLFDQIVEDMDSIPREHHEKQLENLEKMIKIMCRDKVHQVTIG